MNPHGFLEGGPPARRQSRKPSGAGSSARWAATARRRVPEKMHVVSITIGQVSASTRRSTSGTRFSASTRWLPEPALGDFNYEHESTNQQTFGAIKWPTAWHSHQGWDDNFGFDNVSAGHNAFGGTFPNVEPNDCGEPVPVPESVRQAQFGSAAGDGRAAGERRLSARRRTGQQHCRRVQGRSSPCSRRRPARRAAWR